MISRASKIPLAWANLTHDARRLSTSLAGIAFAVVLMFTELGFLNALLDSTVALIWALDLDDNDLLMIHREKETLADTRRFSPRRLYQAEAQFGVESARPLFLESALADWANPQDHNAMTIRVLAADPRDRVFRAPAASRHARELGSIGTALFDLHSKHGYGYEGLARAAAGGEVEALLTGRPIRVVGTFFLGTDFVNEGNLIVGVRTFDECFPVRRALEPDYPSVDLGLVRLARGAEGWRVAETLRKVLPDDVDVLSRREFVAREQGFWKVHTPIGPIFTLGAFLGFVVGVVICIQILSSDIRDHLGEYATLKAIGYEDRYLIGLVFRQAFWLSILGFIPGLVCSAFLYEVIARLTGLMMVLTSGRVILVLSLTVAMCLTAAYLAVRKLFAVDPAELFR